MAILCLLLGHVPALNLQRNQSFAFSHCLRCRRDMIRSDGRGAAGDLASRWRRVPSGMRVRWARSVSGTGQPGSGAPDLLRIGAIALYWKAQDSLRPRPKRARILRLTAQ
ncbi:hypothetical protein GCM10008023_32510 [Sphingomonas glacialis]|uniref:Secreted protein n=1 Tax=Sphingomonas glacialis TaxID=658225 RepID=A0ABQ3LPG4_9SPHN|nr:hypothetical protein [Sphingomonas glacialis]GHH22458.1 hypothetical protein GCM10008023_32510 [Sphingomonas glacialis]